MIRKRYYCYKSASAWTITNLSHSWAPFCVCVCVDGNGGQKIEEKQERTKQGALVYREKKTQTDKKLSSGIIVWLVDKS